MINTAYHLDEIRLMDTIPGNLRVSLQMGDLIFADYNKKQELEMMLTDSNIDFAAVKHAYYIVMVVIR